MATRSVYSGKRVLVASPGAARGTNYTVTVENLFTGDTVSQRARTKKGKVVTALTMNSSGVLKTTIDDGRGNKTVEYSVGTADSAASLSWCMTQYIAHVSAISARKISSLRRRFISCYKLLSLLQQTVDKPTLTTCIAKQKNFAKSVVLAAAKPYPWLEYLDFLQERGAEIYPYLRS